MLSCGTIEDTYKVDDATFNQLVDQYKTIQAIQEYNNRENQKKKKAIEKIKRELFPT